MTGTDLCVNKSQFVPVIFEPPCTLTLSNQPSYMKDTGRATPQYINFIYSGNKDIKCILKTCSTISVLFPTNYHLLHYFIFLCSNNIHVAYKACAEI
jgi:hypothetical protein